MIEATPGNVTQSPPERVLPHADTCHVRSIGAISDFANCLVEQPVECPFVLYFGEGNICRNPIWKQFLRRQKPSPDAETD